MYNLYPNQKKIKKIFVKLLSHLKDKKSKINKKSITNYLKHAITIIDDDTLIT
jgi:hypothetical protein